jgi:hypothetical protein
VWRGGGGGGGGVVVVVCEGGEGREAGAEKGGRGGGGGGVWEPVRVRWRGLFNGGWVGGSCLGMSPIDRVGLDPFGGASTCTTQRRKPRRKEEEDSDRTCELDFVGDISCVTDLHGCWWGLLRQRQLPNIVELVLLVQNLSLCVCCGLCVCVCVCVLWFVCGLCYWGVLDWGGLVVNWGGARLTGRKGRQTIFQRVQRKSNDHMHIPPPLRSVSPQRHTDTDTDNIEMQRYRSLKTHPEHLLQHVFEGDDAQRGALPAQGLAGQDPACLCVFVSVCVCVSVCVREGEKGGRGDVSLCAHVWECASLESQFKSSSSID